MGDPDATHVLIIPFFDKGSFSSIEMCILSSHSSTFIIQLIVDNQDTVVHLILEYGVSPGLFL